jgi:hypothetical protein
MNQEKTASPPWGSGFFVVIWGKLKTKNESNYTDLTGFHQTVELPSASLKTCQVLRDCIVTNEKLKTACCG